MALAGVEALALVGGRTLVGAALGELATCPALVAGLGVAYPAYPPLAVGLPFLVAGLGADPGVAYPAYLALAVGLPFLVADLVAFPAYLASVADLPFLVGLPFLVAGLVSYPAGLVHLEVPQNPGVQLVVGLTRWKNQQVHQVNYSLTYPTWAF